MHEAARHATPLPGVDLIHLTSDRTFPRHGHDEICIGLVDAGGQESWSGRGLVEAEAGHVITANPGELHDGIGRPGAPRRWRMLHASPDVLAHRGREMTRPVAHDPATRAAVARALEAAAGQDGEGLAQALALALEHLTGGMGRMTPARPSATIARLRARIEAEAHLPLTLADHAAVTGLGRHQTLRRFAREVGATPHAYLVQQRVRLARRHIAAGLPLAQAALAAGFADQSHMTRAMTRQTGLTPGRSVARSAVQPEATRSDTHSPAAARMRSGV